MKSQIKKVVYLHGLGAKQGGPKVDFLSANYMVYAPSLDYIRDAETIFEEQKEIITNFQPDLIIGSSMGGYMGDAIASHFGCDVMLFNPATSKAKTYKEQYGLEFGFGNYLNDTKVLLGMKDDVVDPAKSIKYYSKFKCANIIYNADMGHRTPLHVFQDTIRMHFEGIVNPVIEL
jgi:hypothetical protein